MVTVRTTLVHGGRLNVSYDVINGWTLVEVDGEVDIHTQSRIREAVARLIDDGHRSFVLDLRAVPFLDSAGPGAIVAITKQIRAHATKRTPDNACRSGTGRCRKRRADLGGRRRRVRASGREGQSSSHRRQRGAERIPTLIRGRWRPSRP
jgi:anti-anti-sigma factor